jgi:hypothetical protein
MDWITKKAEEIAKKKVFKRVLIVLIVATLTSLGLSKSTSEDVAEEVADIAIEAIE